MSGRYYLVTYRPVIHSKGGRQAARQHSLPPFIDGSCRREPDFESPFPSITSTCRGGMFAPRLQVEDEVAYLTVQGKYLNDERAGWRLVAILRVVERFPSHEAGAAWYRERQFPLPSNCIVDGNPPKPLELTNRMPPGEVVERLAGEEDSVRAIRLWDSTYRGRVKEWPVFLACQAEFLELHEPPQLSRFDMVQIFGRIPGTQSSKKIATSEFAALVRITEAFRHASGSRSDSAE